MNCINSKLRAEEVSRPFCHGNQYYFCFEWSFKFNISDNFKCTWILEFRFLFALCNVQFIFPRFSSINSGVPYSFIEILNCKFLNSTFQLWESRTFSEWFFVKSTKVYRFDEIIITFKRESNAFISSLINVCIASWYFGDCRTPGSCFSTYYT